jgi:hypothetical protein
VKKIAAQTRISIILLMAGNQSYHLTLNVISKNILP